MLKFLWHNIAKNLVYIGKILVSIRPTEGAHGRNTSAPALETTGDCQVELHRGTPSTFSTAM